MKMLTVTKVARNFSAVMDGVERNHEEIILVRNQKPIARLVPEPAEQNADQGDSTAAERTIFRARNCDVVELMVSPTPLFLS